MCARDQFGCRTHRQSQNVIGLLNGHRRACAAAAIAFCALLFPIWKPTVEIGLQQTSPVRIHPGAMSVKRHALDMAKFVELATAVGAVQDRAMHGPAGMIENHFEGC